MTVHGIPAPAANFNFARHLLERNTGRADKTAFIDDHGRLRYGELAQRVRRMAAALLGAGIRREERVLLLMHDCCEWPVAFLGALYAGVVPVAVNTLLTADDYAYMLASSRAQAVVVSAALLPVLQAALDTARAAAPTAASHEVKTIVVVRPSTPLAGGRVAFDAFLASADPMPQAASTGPDDQAFWLFSSGSTGRPKGTVHTHANPYWTAEL